MADRYKSLLAGIPGLGLPAEPAYARSNWQSFCVRLPAHADQQAVMQRMLDAGVSTRRGVMCSHREEPYRNGGKPVSLPRSEAAQDHCILLPLFPQLPAPDQDRIAALLAEACRPR